MKHFKKNILLILLALAFGASLLPAMDNQLIEEVDCMICLDSLRKNVYMRLSCSHEFHVHCIYDWVNKSENKTCPACRKDCGFAVIAGYSNKILESVFAAAIGHETTIVVDIIKQHKAIPKLFAKIIETVLAVPEIGADMQCQILALLSEQILQDVDGEDFWPIALHVVEKCCENANKSVQLSVLALLDVFMCVDYWKAPLVTAQEIAKKLIASEYPRCVFGGSRFFEKNGLCNFLA